MKLKKIAEFGSNNWKLVDIEVRRKIGGVIQAGRFQFILNFSIKVLTKFHIAHLSKMDKVFYLFYEILI